MWTMIMMNGVRDANNADVNNTFDELHRQMNKLLVGSQKTKTNKIVTTTHMVYIEAK